MKLTSIGVEYEGPITRMAVQAAVLRCRRRTGQYPRRIVVGPPVERLTWTVGPATDRAHFETEESAVEIGPCPVTFVMPGVEALLSRDDSVPLGIMHMIFRESAEAVA